MYINCTSNNNEIIVISTEAQRNEKFYVLKTLKRVQGDDILEELRNGFNFVEHSMALYCVTLRYHRQPFNDFVVISTETQ